MRIAILVGGMPPVCNGGTEIATVKIAEHAARVGHEMHIIAADRSGQGDNYYRSSLFQLYTVSTVQPRYLHGLSYIPRATQLLRQISPDLVHVQAMYMCPSAYLMHHRIPYLFYERGGVSLNRILNRPLYYTFMKHATRVVAQTEDQKLTLLKYCEREIEVIPNGVDTLRFGVQDKVTVRRKLQLPLESNIAVSVGRCRPEKNLTDFVRASSLVDVTFVLIGDGPQLGSLRAEGQGRVIFPGEVNNDSIPDYLSAADVLVNTSLSEGFPLSLLEGMASGLPIVAPRVCGIPEIIKDGVNGILTIPHDYQSTAQAINQILENKDLAQRMSLANIEKARQYSWQNVVKKLYN